VLTLAQDPLRQDRPAPRRHWDARNRCHRRSGDEVHARREPAPPRRPPSRPGPVMTWTPSPGEAWPARPGGRLSPPPQPSRSRSAWISAGAASAATRPAATPASSRPARRPVRCGQPGPQRAD